MTHFKVYVTDKHVADKVVQVHVDDGNLGRVDLPEIDLDPYNDNAHQVSLQARV